MKIKNVSIAIFMGICCLSAACSGGGGGDGSDGGGAGSAGSDADGSWTVKAAVASDSCNERLSAVRQTFVISGGRVNTGIVTIGVDSTTDGFAFGFSESNGSCERTYEATFSAVTGTDAAVVLTSNTQCPGVTCSTSWNGAAVKTQ